MPFIDRDPVTNLTKGLYHVEQQPGQEWLPADHPDVVAYKTKPVAKSSLARKIDAAIADPSIPQALKDVLRELGK